MVNSFIIMGYLIKDIVYSKHTFVCSDAWRCHQCVSVCLHSVFPQPKEKLWAILTRPWRWQSQAGSTCHQGNNSSQKFPVPPSWWPFPPRRKQRYSRPRPEGADRCTGRVDIEHRQQEQRLIDSLSTGKGQVLAHFPHQYGGTFGKHLQKQTK